MSAEESRAVPRASCRAARLSVTCVSFAVRSQRCYERERELPQQSRKKEKKTTRDVAHARNIELKTKTQSAVEAVRTRGPTRGGSDRVESNHVESRAERH